MWLTKLETVPAMLLILGLVLLGDEVRAGAQPKGRKESKADKFITRVGAYTLHGGQLTIKVASEKEKKIRWSVIKVFTDERKTRTEHSTNEPLIREGSPWFIYPASADAVWIYDGQK